MSNNEQVMSSKQKEGVQNVDRLLPSQPLLRQHYSGDDDAFFGDLEKFLLSVHPSDLADKWEIELKPGVTYASLGSDLGTLCFFQFLVGVGRCKRVLELGTYIGVSTLYFAEAVGADGAVTTVEFGREFYELAKKNITRNGYADRITAIHGCGVDYLDSCIEHDRKFDLVFVDAAKERYAEMVERALLCLEPGGLILVDDVFMHGDALKDTPTTSKGTGARDAVELAAGLVPDDYGRVILPIGNGLLMIRSKASK